jgi:Tol biopolymer transport system component
MNIQEPSANSQTRLESWKEIGAYLQRDATTARRWEKEEGLPVHRHTHKSRSSVYAFPSEIDAWRATRKVAPEPVPAKPLWKIPAFALTMVLCLVMVGNGVRPVAAQQGGLAKRLLCEGACADNEADLSLDARMMVQTDWGTGDLLIRDMATGRTRRLLVKTGSFNDGSKEQNAYAEKPVFSPDMKQVVYFWDTSQTGANENQLRVVATEPGAASRVVLDIPENDYYEPETWSQDGKSVLALMRKKGDKTWQVAWISIADGAVRQLASLGWRIRGGRMKPSLSPDGRYIAYAALAANPKSPIGPVEFTDTRIYVMSADGSGGTELIKNAGINDNPVWSPDGAHLLFSSDQGGPLSLWSIPVREGKASGPPSLVSGDTGDTWVIGMRGGSLYYAPASTSSVVDYISIARLDGRGSPGRFVGLYPSWSPDGKLLAFTRPRPSARNEANLVVHNMDTGEETVYGQKLEGLRTAPAVWFPDGRSLLKVVVDYDGTVEKPETARLLRLDLLTGQFTEVLKFGSRFLGTDFPVSNDARTLYLGARESETFTSPVNQLVAFDLMTGRTRGIFSLPQGRSIVGMRMSPDGGRILFRSMESNTSCLAVVSADGSGYREIYKGEGISGISWAVDGGSAMFAQRTAGDRWRVMKVPAEGGAASFTGLEVSNQDARLLPAPHPDGVRVAFSSRDRVAQLWSLDNLRSALR